MQSHAATRTRATGTSTAHATRQVSASHTANHHGHGAPPGGANVKPAQQYRYGAIAAVHTAAIAGPRCHTPAATAVALNGPTGPLRVPRQLPLGNVPLPVATTVLAGEADTRYTAQQAGGGPGLMVCSRGVITR